MNILNLTTHLNRGGISQYILSVGSALIQRSHKVFVASSGGEMEQEFRQAGIEPRNFPIRTKSELDLKIYFALPALIRCVRENQIHVIHAHTRITQVIAVWLRRFTGRPYVTTAHGFYRRRLGRKIFPAWGDRTVAISEAVASELQKTHNLNPEKIRVIYNGLDVKEFVQRYSSYDKDAVRKEYGFAPDAFVLGIVARLVSDKGHEYLIRAMKQLESDIPQLNLLIVGDGRYRGRLEELTSQLGLRGRICFAGNLRDVSKPLSAVDIFVLPAVWREGFGLSIAEAMACRKPVIVTNIWALNTLIQNHVNGILVEPKDIDDLARAIRRVMEDDGLRERIGKAGQETAEKQFSMERMVRELESVYEEVLG